MLGLLVATLLQLKEHASKAGIKGGLHSGPNFTPDRERAMAAGLFYGQLSGTNLLHRYVRASETD